MPPASAPKSCVILFDLKTEDRQKGLDSLTNILLYNRLSEVKDECKLFLFNSHNVDAQCAGVSLINSNLTIDALINTIKTFEVGESNWMEAIIFGINELEEEFNKPGIITLQIVVISDLKSFKSEKNKHLEESIIKSLKQHDIFVYFIGPNVQPSKTIFSEHDLIEWMRNLEGKGEYFDFVKRIVTETKSCICSFDLGVHLFNSFKYRKGKQPWTEPLSFGTVLSLPFPTIKITDRQPPFKLQMDKNDTDVKRVCEEQEDVEINMHDTVSGLVRHGKFVRIPDEKLFKIEGPRCFSVLGFTDSKKVPEYLLQGEETYKLVSTGVQDDSYLEFFWTLISVMIELDKYIVAKKVYYANLNPKYVVLIPRLDKDTRGFIVCELPYAEDIAFDYKEENSAPKVQVSKETTNYLDSMNVTSDKCKIQVPLAPRMMIDTNCLNMINKVKEKLTEGFGGPFI